MRGSFKHSQDLHLPPAGGVLGENSLYGSKNVLSAREYGESKVGSSSSSSWCGRGNGKSHGRGGRWRGRRRGGERSTFRGADGNFERCQRGNGSGLRVATRSQRRNQVGFYTRGGTQLYDGRRTMEAAQERETAPLPRRQREIYERAARLGKIRAICDDRRPLRDRSGSNARRAIVKRRFLWSTR